MVKNLPEYHQSIFYPLMEHASDLECKLILIDQMLEIGDKKDLALLEELETHSNHMISGKAFEVRNALLEKLGITDPSEKTLLPMDLCFIYDEFNIEPSKLDPDLDMDFGVPLDIFDV
ncbi:hypothetical protein M3P19_05345 [Muricauda sp. 2012CJ35-5]|uniref:Uncharacterized protein n=1 Tax=Flagellimonas spongiicola TaxID=2942208 RepID=A0ABT0PPW4_9FLAO|nr:hypothetical protein [Allomuricauda spongiicola]MCL6273424.1 hypothetical protein [Allomuricauda spongiicola]